MCKLCLSYCILFRFVNIKDRFTKAISYIGVPCFNFLVSIIASTKHRRVPNRKRILSFDLNDDGIFYKEVVEFVTIYCYNISIDKKEYVLYTGEKFTVEWYFTKEGKSQPFDYFNRLDAKQQMKLLYLVKRMGDFGKIADKTKFNFEHDGIWAFKFKPDRFLSFFTSGKKIIITNAFEKKCEKLPRTEKDKAEKCRMDYEMRVQGGTYYDNI